MQQRGVAARVTDGVIRDIDGASATALPVWCQGTASPPAVAALTFVGWQAPVAYSGVAVFLGDIIVLDNDGVVVIPQAMLAEVVEVAEEQERLEAWNLRQVEKGAALPGLYPPNEQNLARYRAAMNPPE
ncbi:hypothetical protein [Pseudomonas typographi]|uniref:4-hydroxy-4-methyl-2-oxoglutarate aldolase n=1 Tax=Pseudomonas typographi TaxID=2715964 RepID=A0ABR7YVF2_9PSED|nr:hypothetical protein [Pseudomonas typographi]MBD1585136.1 hypothetical protein [Pseudomonas typographi]MBD1597183.1 hypothetical protein [Pseudomonas typographi]